MKLKHFCKNKTVSVQKNLSRTHPKTFQIYWKINFERKLESISFENGKEIEKKKYMQVNTSG